MHLICAPYITGANDIISALTFACSNVNGHTNVHSQDSQTPGLAPTTLEVWFVRVALINGMYRIDRFTLFTPSILVCIIN